MISLTTEAALSKVRLENEKKLTVFQNKILHFNSVLSLFQSLLPVAQNMLRDTVPLKMTFQACG